MFQIMLPLFIGMFVACIIVAIMIVTDNTPDSAYDFLAGKYDKEDWFHE
jgi:hypothetical protein